MITKATELQAKLALVKEEKLDELSVEDLTQIKKILLKRQPNLRYNGANYVKTLTQKIDEELAARGN